MPNIIAPPSPTQQLAHFEDPTPCQTCNLTFPTWVAFHAHKMSSKKHITCDICSFDFRTHEGQKKHHDEVHSAVQKLECPGCAKVFTRLGSLIGHLEVAGCKSIKKDNKLFNFSEVLQEKKKFYEKYSNARNFNDYGRTAGDFADEEPKPMVKDYAMPEMNANSIGIDNTTRPLAYAEQPIASTYVAEEEDLMRFDAPSNVLNAPWGASAPVVTFDKAKDFPALKSYKNPETSIINIMDAPANLANTSWDKKQNLFPDAPAAVAPPTELMASLSVDPADVQDAMSPYDPDNPEFNASRYYVAFLQKFKCPHLGCRKCLDSTFAFIQHLKSPAHRKEKLQCVNCLRYYDTATALTQHSESQGVRCKVRETDQYSAEVDKFTAGTAGTAGRLHDNTVKYVINDGFKPDANGSTGILEANKAANEAREAEKNSYWDRNTPIW